MKTFKQFIRENEINEVNYTKALAGLAVIAGLQAGAMHDTPIPSVVASSKSVSNSDNETRTSILNRTSGEKKGTVLSHATRGFLDLKPRETLKSTSSDIPSTSSIRIFKQGNNGTTMSGRERVGGKTARLFGSSASTDLRNPTNTEIVSGHTNLRKHQ